MLMLKVECANMRLIFRSLRQFFHLTYFPGPIPIHIIFSESFNHGHESVRARRGQNMPPAVELEQETPRHTPGTFSLCQLRAISKVCLPQHVANDEAGFLGSVQIHLPY